MKLKIKNLNKRFAEKQVLNNTTFTFEEGKIYGLIGRNGAGKTTFFNCINEDVIKDSGEIQIEKDGITSKLDLDDIGYVLSTPVVPEFLTAREFIKFFIDINKEQIENQKTIDEYFELMKIEKSDRDKIMKEYSHGMKNKMQMLINIIKSPDVLLLDEPLTSLDIVVADEMKKLLREIKKNHIIIFSTHILELAMDLCDEIVILNNGKLELIERNALDQKDFKEKIISTLKGEDHV